MPTFPRHLLSIFLGLLFVFSAVPDLHAEKRIGVIMTGDIPYYGTMHESFVTEINKRFPGEKVEIVLQKPFPNPISWSNAARKLIAFDVDLIVTFGSPATLAVLHEKSRIPLVYAGIYEPEQATVTGKNVTGCGFKVPISSIVRYFKRLKPVSTLGIIYSSAEEDSVRQYEAMKLLAAQQNITVEKIDLLARPDLEKLKKKQLDAVFITGGSLVHLWINDILTILKKNQVPTADIFPDDSNSGILMTLFQPPRTQGKMAGEMAAQILVNKNPDSIASQTFRDTELVFNLIEARKIGITFPIYLLIEATKVIQ